MDPRLSTPCPSYISHYEIVDLLRIGGFGIVFRGFAPLAGREVAIKIPRPEFLSARDLIERFAREAFTTAQLDHLNIVPIYETNYNDLVPDIVMPFVVGMRQDQWLDQHGALPPRVAALTVQRLALTIAHAHQRKILHRDVKPRKFWWQHAKARS